VIFVELKILDNPITTDNTTDQLLLNNKGSTIYQTSAFAESLKRNGFSTPKYLYVLDDGEVAALLVVLVDKQSAMKSFFQKMQWFHGPVVLAEGGKVDECYSLLFDGLDHLSATENIFTISDSIPPYFSTGGAAAFDKRFSEHGFSLEPSATFAIDLTQEQGQIFSRMDKSCRKNIRDCETKGIELKRADSEDEVTQYNSLLKEFREKNRLPLPPVYPSLGIWKDLHGTHLDIFIATKGNEVISGMGTFKFNGIIFEAAVARSDYEMENKIYPQDLIKWGIITNGKAENARIYDLAGVSPNPTTDKEKGIYRFKEKWGGNLIKFNKYSKTYSDTKKKIFDMIKSLRNVMK